MSQSQPSTSTSALPGKLRAILAGRGIWALADQAVLSLANFLIARYILRTLPEHESGIYAVLFGVLIFLNSLHTSLVTYPLSITGATATDEPTFRRRTRFSVMLTAMLFPLLSLGIVIAVSRSGRWELLLPSMAALICWQAQETLRRAMMSRLRHRDALLGDAITYLGQVLCAWIAIHSFGLTLQGRMWAIAITSATGAAIQAFQLTRRGRNDLSETPASSTILTSSSMVKEHVKMGRWVLFTNLTSVITIQAMPWTLAYFHNYGTVAAFAALATLVGVCNPVLTSLSGLIVPAVAKANLESGPRAAAKAAMHYGMQGAALLFPFFAVLIVAPRFSLTKMYGASSPYVGLTTPLILFAVTYALFFVGQIAAAFLNGLGQSHWSFVAQMTSVVGNLALNLPLAAYFGLKGAVWGGLLPIIIQLATTAWFVRKAMSPMKNAMVEDAANDAPLALKGAVA